MNNRTIWLVLLLIVGVVAGYFVFKNKGTSTEDTTQKVTPMDQLSEEENTAEGTYQPQNTLDNPRQESVDPFIVHNDFEVLLKSAKNKSDFDFSFAAFEGEMPKYKLADGVLDFKLNGTLQTGVNLEDNVSLNIEFYDNNQVSFTKRRKHSEDVLTYTKERAKKENTDKNLYRFDFTKKLQLTPGLYYFTIAPKGRNRVLYAGKFEVR